MSQLPDLFALLALAAVAGLWLKSSRARERAVDEARRQCMQHGLQLLDETVGLRNLRLSKVAGRRRLELGYAFEVSTRGDDRLDGRLWMRGGRLVSVSLPDVEPPSSAQDETGLIRSDNVIPLRPRRRIEH